MSKFDDIAADFEFLEEWDDRYKYIIELGRCLEPYPEVFRDDAHKVRGCASQVWLHASHDGQTISFVGDSDAHIVKGLVAILLTLYSGKSSTEILDINPEAALAPFDLKDHLTPQRSNGLASMVQRIRAIANSASQS